MIDPNWELVDLDPITWRNIGPFFMPSNYVRAGDASEHGLFILHDGGTLLSSVDSQTGQTEPIEFDPIEGPRPLADRLFASGQWDRVHVIDRMHLRRVAEVSQTVNNRPLNLDQYYHFVYQQIWDGGEGYICLPPKASHWNHWTYGQVESFVLQFTEPRSVGLGVFDGDDLYIGLIARIADGLIRKVTTFETPGFPQADARLSADFLANAWQQLDDLIAPPAALLLCTRAVFESWLTGKDKSQMIQNAVSSGDAFLRVAGDVEGEAGG